MIYLNRRIKIGIIVIIVSIIILTRIYKIINCKKSVNTVSLPVSGKTIVLDAGHGNPDEGDLLLHKENKQLTFYK